MTSVTTGPDHPSSAGRTGARWAVLVVLAAVLGGLVPVGLALGSAPRAHAATSTEVYAVPGSRTFKLSGLGFGHGIGMSQFGAEGMGQLGKSYRQIMNFYFPGTSFAQTRPTRQITVGLSGVVQSTPQGSAAVVVDTDGLSASNRGNRIDLPRRVGGRSVTEFRVVRGSDGLAVFAVSGAGATRIAKGLSGAVTWQTATSVDDSRVRVAAAAGGSRLYRGFLEVKKGSTSVLAISRLRLEDYLRSVVSHEVPSSWTAAALRAQAVAARSYALTSQITADATHRPYDICDTTYCQAYGSISIESRAESRAVKATSGVYLRSAGQPVLAMFSSANGGYSVAGGRPYLVAQPDPYDGVVTGTANWGHQWSASIGAGSIERSWPQIGRLQKLKVLGRDGNGQWGGRVLSVGLVGSKSTVTVSADSFRWAVGLKSTWWTITNADGSIEAPAKNVRVERGDLSALVRWGAPDTDRAVKGYRVTVSSTDDVYRLGRAARKVKVKGLTNGKEYRARVVPVYRSGTGPGTVSSAFVPISPSSYFQPLSATRVVDRGSTPSLDHGGRVAPTVVGQGLAPTSGTRAVTVRVTAAASRDAGRVEVWACGADSRTQVAVTYRSAGPATGTATVPVSAGGRVCLGASTTLRSLDVDLLGYYTSSGVGTKSLRAVAARRLVTSETGKGWTTGRLVSGDPRTVQIAGREGVPDDVRSVVLNLSLVDPTRAATLSIAPGGTPVSLGAVVSSPSGTSATSTVVARLDSSGRLPLRLTSGRADVHVDVLGWYRPHDGSRSGRYRSLAPVTVLTGSPTMTSGDATTVRVRGGSTGVPGSASAVVLQVVANGGSTGSISVMPAGSVQDPRSVLIFGRHGVQRASVVVPVGDDGSVTVTSKGADSAVSMRVVGWFS